MSNLVNGKGGGVTDVTAFKTALSLENVDNTSDANKPVSAAQAAADAVVLASAASDATTKADAAQASAAVDATAKVAAEAALRTTGDALALPKSPTSLTPDIFFDSFNRADTASSAIGTGETGQSWVINGSGSANARISGAGLRTVSPRGTMYCWPQLSYNVKRFGCSFRFETGGGGAGYVNAMILSKAASSLVDMLHITWNANSIYVEDWRSSTPGDSIIASRTFAAPLQAGMTYTVEIEIVPELDLVILRAPDGKITTGTHANVSEYHTPYCAFETIDSDTGVLNTIFDSCWAFGNSETSSLLVTLANAMSGRGASVVTTNDAGSIHSATFGASGTTTTISSAGLISARPDTDTVHHMGRCRITGTSDTATFSHYDFTALGSCAVQQGSFGNTSINSATGQNITIQQANTVLAFFGSAGLTMADAKNIVFNATTGTKIGTTTSQKLAFWNATPVIQPTAVADATDAPSVITQLNALLAKLRTIGIIAT